MDAEPASDVDECRVARLGQCILEGQCAVTVAVVAVDGFCAVDLIRAVAIVAVGVHRDSLLLNGSGSREDLEDRAGYIQLRDRLILPLLLAGGDIGILILRLRERLQCGTHALVIDHRGVIQIKGRVGRHCIDRAGLGVHDDAAGTVLHIIIDAHFLQIFLKAILQCGIER